MNPPVWRAPDVDLDQWASDVAGSCGRSNQPPHPRRVTTANFQSLPAGNAAHVRQMVSDTLVTIDADLLANEQKTLVGVGGTRRLLGDVCDQGLKSQATAAGTKVVSSKFQEHGSD